jgi:hypothetical protein
MSHNPTQEAIMSALRRVPGDLQIRPPLQSAAQSVCSAFSKKRDTKTGNDLLPHSRTKPRPGPLCRVAASRILPTPYDQKRSAIMAKAPSEMTLDELAQEQ